MIRRLAALLIALSLVVTGAGAGYARGMAPAVGEMVLCRGLVAVTVAVDAQGRPTAPAHLCPDEATGLFADAAVDAPALRGIVLLPVRAPAVAAASETGRCIPIRGARGPPVLS